MKWRIISLITFFGGLYIFLIFNLYNLQFNKNSYYEAKAESQEIATGVLNANRGNIYFVDKNNNKVFLALNKEFSLIYAVPKEIDNPKTAAVSLGKLLNLSSVDLEANFLKKGDLYEEIKYKASDEEVSAVKDLNIKGIYVKKQRGRYYPFGSLASQLMGFTAEDENVAAGGIFKGKYGVESFFNDKLSGNAGVINGDRIISSTDGENVELTLDVNIEAQAEDILKKLVDTWKATSGTVIVEDPKSGKILAMGSFPNFDPNDFSKSEIKSFLNPAVQMVYEPGSVFKILTMSAGIDSGKITPDTTYTDTGSVKFGSMVIKNWDHKTHGTLTMTNVIEQSLNTGTIFAERQMGHQIFTDYVKKFGIGDKTGIDLPGELNGNLVNLSSGRDVNFATASFGQGISVTPIEMINAASAIANGGLLMKPIILANEQPEVIRRVISEDTSRKVTQMMVSAVKKNVLADIPSYNVAGKTGTAFIPDFGHGGYSDQVINTYIGFAPAFDPKFIILIKLEKPQNAPLAGQTVVPAFKELAEFILNYYNITPDKS